MTRSTDLAVWRRVDAVCRQFESAWSEGGRPRPEDYLDRVPDAERGTLLQELLGIDPLRRIEAEELTVREHFGRHEVVVPAVGYYRVIALHR